jgi:hypothetical protein
MRRLSTEDGSAWSSNCLSRDLREGLNQAIIFSEAHARRLLRGYFDYYHDDRTHLGLDKKTPGGRQVEPVNSGQVKRRFVVGGLHSRYYQEAAEELVRVPQRPVQTMDAYARLRCFSNSSLPKIELFSMAPPGGSFFGRLKLWVS